jgi:hypothetical protein
MRRWREGASCGGAKGATSMSATLFEDDAGSLRVRYLRGCDGSWLGMGNREWGIGKARSFACSRGFLRPVLPFPIRDSPFPAHPAPHVIIRNNL